MSTTSVSQNGTYVIKDTERYPDGTYHVTRNDSFTSTSAVILYSSRTDPIKRRRPSGWVAPLAYQHRLYEVKRARGTVSETIFHNGNVGDYYTYRTSDIGLQSAAKDPALKEIFADNSTNFSADIAKAELQALLKLKNQRFNAGVALGESRQLAHHIGSTASKIAKSYSALRHGKWKKAGKYLGLNLKSQPGHWLELQYGWKPLLSDVHGAAEALSQRNDVGDWVTTVKASVSRTVTVADDFSVSGSSSGPYYARRRSDFYGTYVRLDYKPSSFDYLHIPAALGLTNPASVAWELVPFSFVVDWFTPVGDWLSALDATLGFTFLSGTRSTIRRRTGTYRSADAYSHYWVSSGQKRYMSGDASAGLYQVELDRTLYASSPMPAPRMKNPVSVGHMANGLGLLYQVFKLGRY